MHNKRINIFTGHFGSGKTEVAVNFALKLSAQHKTAIVDLDIVNPYFRTADAKTELESRGIRVITPVYANTNVDVPALPPDINSMFEKKEYTVVLDAGGDDIGAKALARYNQEIMQDDFEMFFVVNTRRPMTDSVEKIEGMVRDIESSSRLRVTGLINNTNVLQYTTSENVAEGHKTVMEVSKRLNIPVAFTSGFYDALKSLEGVLDTEFLYLEKLIRLPWDKE